MEGVLYNKEQKITRMFEFKENVLREFVTELKNTQTEMRKVNERLRSDKLIYLSRQLETLAFRLDAEIADTVKERAENEPVEVPEEKRRTYSGDVADKKSQIL